MEKLTVNNILSAADDVELCQYKVLSALKSYVISLRSNKLFPAYSELNSVDSCLIDLKSRKSYIKKLLLEKIAPFNLVGENEIYYEPDDFDDEIKTVMDFIDWIQPRIDEALAEANAIFEFVSENMIIEKVANETGNKKEGIFLLPDLLAGAYHVYRYEYYTFSSNGEAVKSLRTDELDSFDMDGFDVDKLKTIILKITENHPDFSAPGMLNCKCDLELPFYETVLPIAKRKLIETLDE